MAGPNCHVLADDSGSFYGVAQGHGEGPSAEVAAAASLRACARLRSPDAAPPSLAQMFTSAARELHQLRSAQHGYAGMASSLALLSFTDTKAELGIVGDCVAFVEIERSWTPLLCGRASWLGPSPTVEPVFESLERRPGLRFLLALGGALAALTPSGRASLEPAELLARAHALSRQRGAATLLVESS